MTEELGEITACYAIRFERRSKHSPARLWAALTNPDEVSHWMEGPAQIDLRVGGVWKVDFTDHDRADSDQEENLLDGIVIGVEPERRLAYAWGLSVCEWTIEDAADGCTYRFVQNGLADRGEDEEGLAAGWHGFFDQLDMHMDGKTFDKDTQAADWERLKAPYRARLDAAIPTRPGLPSPAATS